MECPCCGCELEYHDYYGFYLGGGNWNRKGDIYKCPNEECESEVHNYYYYTDIKDNLFEGYPC